MGISCRQSSKWLVPQQPPYHSHDLMCTDEQTVPASPLGAVLHSQVDITGSLHRLEQTYDADMVGQVSHHTRLAVHAVAVLGVLRKVVDSGGKQKVMSQQDQEHAAVAAARKHGRNVDVAIGRQIPAAPAATPPPMLNLPFPVPCVFTLSRALSMILIATVRPVARCSAFRTLQKPPLPSNGPSTYPGIAFSAQL